MYLYCKLKGGFANQCIQYLFACSVSRQLGRDLILDVSDYSFDGLFQKLKGNTVQKSSEGYFSNSYKRVNTPVRHVLSFFCGSHFTDASSISDIWECKDKIIFLNGYWHDRVFIDLIDPVDISSLRYSLSSSVNLDKMKYSLPRIGVHVRRGDYLTGKHRNVYGVCSKEYYDKAISNIINLHGINKYELVVITDDIDWVECDLFKDSPYNFHCNNDNFIGDFCSFMLCDHYIISNSSFSWLASTLGRNNKSICYSPSNFFIDKNRLGLPIDDFIKIDGALVSP